MRASAGVTSTSTARDKGKGKAPAWEPTLQETEHADESFNSDREFEDAANDSAV